MARRGVSARRRDGHTNSKISGISPTTRHDTPTLDGAALRAAGSAQKHYDAIYMLLYPLDAEQRARVLERLTGARTNLARSIDLSRMIRYELRQRTGDTDAQARMLDTVLRELDLRTIRRRR